MWRKGKNVDNKNVIQVSHLTKMYKLYDKPSDRLKEALGLTRKKLYREHYGGRVCGNYRNQWFR